MKIIIIIGDSNLRQIGSFMSNNSQIEQYGYKVQIIMIVQTIGQMTKVSFLFRPVIEPWGPYYYEIAVSDRAGQSLRMCSCYYWKQWHKQQNGWRNPS